MHPVKIRFPFFRRVITDPFITIFPAVWSRSWQDVTWCHGKWHYWWSQQFYRRMPTQRKGIRSQAELGTTTVEKKGLRIHFHHHHLVFYHYRSDRNAKPPIKMLRSRRGFIAKRCVILQFCWSRSRQWTVRLSEIHLTLKLLQEAHKSWRNWTRTKEKIQKKKNVLSKHTN